MLPLRVTFLGTGAGMPTSARRLPAVALTRAGEVILFDCGEGTQMQARKTDVRLSRLSRICISHLHGDHVLGLPGLLMSLGLNGRKAPLAIHGPPGIEEFVLATRRMLQAFEAFPLHVSEHDGAERIAHGGGFAVECHPLEHRLPCLGYAVVEDALPGSLDVAAARRLGVPDGPPMGRLKAGHPVTLPGGAVVAPSAVLRPGRPGRRVAYCTDTRPSAGAVALGCGADLLIHEASFAADRTEDARAKGHSTAGQAAEVALQAGARRLALTHISPRYTDPTVLLAEAQAVFPETVVAQDLLSLDL